MNIIKSYPPNIDKIRAHFEIRSNTVFTYGDNIYAPLVTGELPLDLIAHEKTHTIQQGPNPEGWWDRYIKDSKFRLEQEVEAYRNQYKFFCRFVKKGSKQQRFLGDLAKDLSSPLYDNIISFYQALQFIGAK